MSFLDKLERALGRFAVPNISLFVVIGQVFVLMAVMFRALDPDWLDYVPVLAMHGQWWRILTFLFLVPVPVSLIGYVFTAFGWYLFYLMGSALEGYWGAFRYNVFLFISYALTVSLAFVTPGQPVSNLYILGSVFLAFAYLNPDFELILFFILPVKIKWLALLTCIGAALKFAQGGLGTRLQIAAPFASLLLFFGADAWRTFRHGRRTAARRAQAVDNENEPRHVCHVCGKTDLSHPDLDFRYCSKCAGDQCYCPEHIHNHAHVVAAEGKNPS
jgi:hypothetical protein